LERESQQDDERAILMSHVVIVGGSRGLGKELALNFMQHNFQVTVLSRTHPDIENVNYVPIDLELISQESVNEVVAKSIAIGGDIKYLIFCQRFKGKTNLWEGEIKVSLTATKMLIDKFTMHFISEGDRAIGIVSSVYANFVGGSQDDSYHVAKAGLNQLVKYNAIALGKKGIRINSIMPLTYLKKESEQYYLSDNELINLYKDFVPLGRMGHVKDSVNLLDFLCSERASFITGQSIFVDGGVSVIWPEELAKKLGVM
jgi:NAD(P)-dependent dehydrogenase (short-subunit alcohol dehydrogenase family)